MDVMRCDNRPPGESATGPALLFADKLHENDAAPTGGEQGGPERNI